MILKKTPYELRLEQEVQRLKEEIKLLQSKIGIWQPRAPFLEGDVPEITQHSKVRLTVPYAVAEGLIDEKAVHFTVKHIDPFNTQNYIGFSYFINIPEFREMVVKQNVLMVLHDKMCEEIVKLFQEHEGDQ